MGTEGTATRYETVGEAAMAAGERVQRNITRLQALVGYAAVALSLLGGVLALAGASSDTERYHAFFFFFVTATQLVASLSEVRILHYLVCSSASRLPSFASLTLSLPLCLCLLCSAFLPCRCLPTCYSRLVSLERSSTAGSTVAVRCCTTPASSCN
jgi:hypothetical protein